MQSLRRLWPILLLTACSSTDSQELALRPADFESWRSERIALPPEFAPGLPSGDELLLFAPGMFDPEAEDFWSYAFIMQVDEGDVSAERMTQLFEEYYDGLILAVAGGQGADVGSDPASVQLTPAGEGRFEAEVRLIEAFVTMQPLELRVLIEVSEASAESTTLRVQASPRPAGHKVWRSLAYAAANLEL